MSRFKRAFTLIELLVVIAIIAILAAILFPVFAQAKEAAKKTTDISNFKQIGTSVAMYLTDYDDHYIMSNTGGHPTGWGFGPPDTVPGQQLMPYSKNTQIHVCPKDPYSEERRWREHASDMGWNPTTITPEQKMYGLMVRSNVGMNYAFFSPWRYGSATNFVVTSASVSASEVTSPSSTLLFITSIWYRDAGGNPTGGGNWVVETPCWKDSNNAFLRPLSKYAPGTGDGSLQSYFGGWAPPTNPPGGNAWLVYGGTWPYWNQKSLSNIQSGLQDGHVITSMADTSTKSMPVKRLTDGCTAYGTGSFVGRVVDSSKFIWDLD